MKLWKEICVKPANFYYGQISPAECEAQNLFNIVSLKQPAVCCVICRDEKKKKNKQENIPTLFSWCSLL